MRFHHVIVATLAVCALPSTRAFTLGELLLPSYLCGPAVANADGTITGTDGKPKALGGVLANLQEYTFATSKEVDANNDFLYDPVTDPMIFLGAMHNAHAAHVSKQFHGGDRRPLPPGGNDTQKIVVVAGGDAVPGNIYTGMGEAKLGPIQDYNNKTIPIKAQTNVLQVVGIPAIPPPIPPSPENAEGVPGSQIPSPTNFTTIRPNQLVILSLGAQNDVAGRTGAANFFDPANGGDNALDGAIVYAQDTKNVRIGKFVADAENVAVPWAACGADGAGLVHAQLLSDTNVFNGAQFFVPFNFAWKKSAHPGPAVTDFTMMGAAVSDGGFGYHQTKWQVKPYDPLVIDVATLNGDDRAKCLPARNAKPKDLACAAPCFDCIRQAGSTQQKSVANTATFTCTANTNIGTGLTMTPATVYSSTCKIKNKVTATVPVGTEAVPPPKPADAAGYSPEDQAYLDAMTQAFAAAGAGTDPTQQTTCPTTNNQVNTANTHASASWFTTIITVAVSAIAAARR